ncbi:Protein bfr2 [Erysiphe neolycopersici]|uniref:Protein BFR2 n=1 Tax=Erysiphe neolycopersici TaxID=212602 RepID=A0A420HY29_9PEZI|nr:Protein bfr2 [Erysiphe neolycopersici]
MGKSKTLTDKISKIAYPTPKEFDPEDEYPVIEQETSEDEDKESSDDLAGTEHYVQSGKSKLRRPEEINLGPKYLGSQISRQDLFADEENHLSDELNDKSNSANFEGLSDSEEIDSHASITEESINSDDTLDDHQKLNLKRLSSRTNSTATNNRKVSSESSKSNEEEENDLSGDDELDHLDDFHFDKIESDDSNSDSSDSTTSKRDDKEKVKRSEIQRFMEEDQKAILSTLSQAAKADAEKGRAIKSQRMRFDTLLNVRMELQKALIAVNTLPTFQDNDPISPKDKPYEAAEEAAMKLWNRLYEFRKNLSKTASTHKTSRKRKILSTHALSPIMWEKMKDLEAASIDNRRKIIEKWSVKTRGSMTLPLTEKLNPTLNQQSIISILNNHIEDSEHLVRRTKMPRSCAPVQRDLKIVEDPKIYDDGNFYQMLLKELVEQRRSESTSMPMTSSIDNKPIPLTAIKEPKVRKVVDTRASKGRKMRFTVHEKLQNFAAPEDRSSWEQVAVSRLFATLLGQKAILAEDDQEKASDLELEEKSLRLFRS